MKYKVHTSIKNKTVIIEADKWTWITVSYPFKNGVQFLTEPDENGDRYIVDQVFNVTEEPKLVK